MVGNVGMVVVRGDQRDTSVRSVLPAFLSRVYCQYCLVNYECLFILVWTRIGLLLTACPVFISPLLFNQSVSKLGLRRAVRRRRPIPVDH